MPLSILIWLPLAFALVGAIAGRRWAPRVVLGGSLITLGLAVYYLFAFNQHDHGLQFLTDRLPATTKLVSYALVGSLLMLAGAIATWVLAGGQTHITFVLSELQQVPLSKGSQEWIFLFFAAAFLVKMPAVPLHGWMPDGYRAMPLPVLAVFSGVLSKVAAYGFLRIVLPIYPDAAAHFQTLLLLIALASILYGSIMAFTVT